VDLGGETPHLLFARKYIGPIDPALTASGGHSDVMQ
jgi:hypothetical protein